MIRRARAVTAALAVLVAACAVAADPADRPGPAASRQLERLAWLACRARHPLGAFLLCTDATPEVETPAVEPAPAAATSTRKAGPATPEGSAPGAPTASP